MEFTFSHQSLGSASLQERFGQSQALENTSPSDEIDATRITVCPVSPINGFKPESTLIGQKLPLESPPTPSDTEDLNVNIINPAASSNNNATASARLPVLVFIHGGGFAIASNWYPQYDQAELVRLSARIGHPIIAVTVK
ncbi:hypothetical protein BJY01DRAFT_249724 [Aspergillus pseudoustus]|uniref:Carboxylesterase type B domain-containing protein n=1 Tax=Aspergillus pseudoustus TaxID=1810923 RepID=A0ABR4JLT7_9EURO